MLTKRKKTFNLAKVIEWPIFDISVVVKSGRDTRFFCKQYFHKQRQAEISKKSKQMLSNTLRLNFSSSTLSLKINRICSKK